MSKVSALINKYNVDAAGGPAHRQVLPLKRPTPSPQTKPNDLPKSMINPHSNPPMNSHKPPSKRPNPPNVSRPSMNPTQTFNRKPATTDPPRVPQMNPPIRPAGFHDPKQTKVFQNTTQNNGGTRNKHPGFVTKPNNVSSKVQIFNKPNNTNNIQPTNTFKPSQTLPTQTGNCQICGDTLDLIHFGCGHFTTCLNCASEWLASSILEKRIPNCLQCNKQMYHSVAKKLIQQRQNQSLLAWLEELFESKNEQMLTNIEGTNHNIKFTWCATPDCSTKLINLGQEKAFCYKCQYYTCCKHEARAFNSGKQTDICCMKGEDAASEALIAQISKQCPKCNVPIEKNNGCNHMTCRNCTHEFFWCCLRDYRDLAQSRLHFQNC